MAVENSTRAVKRKSSDTPENIARKKRKHHAQTKRSYEFPLKDSTMSRREASAPKPPRPKRATTFTLPNHLRPPVQTTTSTIKSKQSSRSPTPNLSTKSEPPLTRLTRISILLEAMHRRNKNQHRNQPFYKHFNLLRRAVTRLLNLHEESTSDDNRKPFSSISSSTGSSSAEQVRQRFEQESRLRSQREVHEKWIRETIVPGAYVGFTGLIADTQFAQLGIVLLGILTDVTSVVGLMRKVDVRTIGKSQARNVKSDQRRGGGTEVVGLSTLVTGPDRGEVVKRIYGNDGGVRGVVEEVVPLDDDKDMINGKEHADEDLGESIDRASHERARNFTTTVAAATDGKQDSNVSAPATAPVSPHEDDMELDGTRTSTPPPSPSSHLVIAEQQPHPPPPLTSPLPSPQSSQKIRQASSPPQHSPSSINHAPDPTFPHFKSKSKFISKHKTLESNDQTPDHKNEVNSSMTTITTTTTNERNNTVKMKKEKAKANKKNGKKKNAIDDLFSGFG